MPKRGSQNQAQSKVLKAIGIIFILLGVINIIGRVVTNQILYSSMQIINQSSHIITHPFAYHTILEAWSIIQIIFNVCLIIFGFLIYTDKLIDVFKALKMD
jgi:hypothetical protein